MAPKKKPPVDTQELPDGIDLSDFDEDKVAGLDLSKDPTPEPVKPKPAPVGPESPAAVPAVPEVPTLRALPDEGTPPATPAAPPPRPEPPAEASPPPAPDAPPPTPQGAVMPYLTPAPPPPFVSYPVYPQTPYGYSPYPVAPFPYPVAAAPAYGAPAAYAPYYPPQAFPAPPANRAWWTKSGADRLRTTALIGFSAFALSALVRLFEAGTGMSAIPGSAEYGTFGVVFLHQLLLFFEAGGFIVAAIGGGASVFALRRGAKEIAVPAGEDLKRGTVLLALAFALPAAGYLAQAFYLSSVQQALPGSGIGSDLGLERLYENYRLAAAGAAMVNFVAAFLAVRGLQLSTRGLLPVKGRNDFSRFARFFVVGAAASAALTIIAYYLVMGAPTLEAPASPASGQGLLAIGSVIAMFSFIWLRRAAGFIGPEAERIASTAPAGAAKAEAPT